MAYIFLDESGQFTKDSGGYFIVGSFMVGDPRRTEKRFRSWVQGRFPRKLRYLPEIKWANKDIDDKLRLKTLREIAKLDVRIRYTYMSYKNIPLEFRKKKEIRTGHLYTRIVADTLFLYLPLTDSEFRVFCDRRHLKGIRKSEFESILKSQLIESLPPRCIIQIEMTDSTSNANIQIADWISGALSRYHNGKSLGEECWEVIKNNVLGEGVELFKSSKTKNSALN